eukprot:703917-Hanusia_phi.AAC.2
MGLGGRQWGRQRMQGGQEGASEEGGGHCPPPLKRMLERLSRKGLLTAGHQGWKREGRGEGDGRWAGHDRKREAPAERRGEERKGHALESGVGGDCWRS